MGQAINKLENDIKRYKELKAKLNPNNDLFIEMGNSEEWKEFNHLTIILTPIIVMGGLG